MTTDRTGAYAAVFEESLSRPRPVPAPAGADLPAAAKGDAASVAASPEADPQTCIDGTLAHHWILPPLDGSPVLIGVCKRCGAEKPGRVWEPVVAYTSMGPRKQKGTK